MKKLLKGGECQAFLLCALTQKRLLLEDALVNKGEQRRSRSVVIVVVVGSCAVSSFALQQKKSSKAQRISAPCSSHLAHLQRDPVVFPRYESVDVIVPELLHHGRQLPVTLDHHGASSAALLVLQWWAVAGWVSENASNERKRVKLKPVSYWSERYCLTI